MFVALFTYGLRRAHGVSAIDGKLRDYDSFIRASLEDGPNASAPCFRTLHAARTLEEVELHVEASNPVAKARSRALTRFLRCRPHDVAIFCDEDVAASPEALAQLVGAARGSDGIALALLPCADGRPNCYREPSRAPLPPAPWEDKPVGGVALAAISAKAALAICKAHPTLRYAERDRSVTYGVFLEYIEQGRAQVDVTLAGGWVGEDIAFCRRAHVAGVHVEVLRLSDVTHEGQAIVDPTNDT